MQTLPALRRHCPVCGKLLSLHERHAGGGHCTDWMCRHRRLEAARKAELAERMRRDRDAAAAAVGDPSALHAPVVVVRWYDTPLVPVPDSQRAALREHLMALAPQVQALIDAAAAGSVDPADPADPAEPEPAPLPASAQAAADEVDALLGQVCARCTGYCCRLGFSRHAFLDAAVLLKARLARPQASHAELTDAYLDELPALHHAGSCGFHGERGCVLSRSRRAAICNAFECPALESTRLHAERDGVRRVFVVRHDEAHGPDGGFAPPLPETGGVGH